MSISSVDPSSTMVHHHTGTPLTGFDPPGRSWSADRTARV
jgi:hypothetical protein